VTLQQNQNVPLAGGGAMIDDEIWLVCFRVADMPTPKMTSVRQKCAGCHAPIWVAKKSPAVALKLCLQCTTRGRDECDELIATATAWSG
jgi:hypothetical protein